MVYGDDKNQGDESGKQVKGVAREDDARDGGDMDGGDEGSTITSADVKRTMEPVVFVSP